MSILEALILGLAQGLTEFIPVSSSGHLVLLHQALGLEQQALSFDVALHIGTLLALVMYFYKDIWQLFLGILGKNKTTKLAWLIVLGTIPAVVSGVLLQSAAETSFRSSNLVAINLAVVGGIMLLAEWYSKRYQHKRPLDKFRVSDAGAIGLAQAAAIIPGISRSGSTITTGLFLGLDRVAATRFSFLLGIPITAGAVAKVLSDSDTIRYVGSDATIFVIGIAMALISGMAAIRFLLKYLSKHTLAVFAYYRIGLAAIVLILGILR